MLEECRKHSVLAALSTKSSAITVYFHLDGVITLSLLSFHNLHKKRKQTKTSLSIQKMYGKLSASLLLSYLYQASTWHTFLNSCSPLPIVIGENPMINRDCSAYQNQDCDILIPELSFWLKPSKSSLKHYY